MKIKQFLLFSFTLLNLSVFAQCALTSTITVGNAFGGVSNGYVSANPSNGTSPYSYVWGGGQTTSSLSNLGPGTYTVTITDANLCTTTTTGQVNAFAGPTILSNSNAVSSYQVVNGGFTPQWVCANQTLQTDGGIMKIYLESGATMITGGGIDTVFAKTGSTITMTGGIHVIYHEPGVILNMNGGIPTLYPCPSLVFDYSLAPAGGCTPVLTCNLAVALSVGNTIGGGNNGSINSTVSNGTFPFTYAWSTGQTTSSLNNLTPGAYSVIVTDANGCADTAAATLINLAGPTVLPNSNVVSSYQVVNGGYTPQWVCPNDTLYTDGGIMNIYLESGATMITGGGIDSIFAKTGSTIIMNGGIHRIYHEPGVNLVMNGGIPYLYPCPSLVFNYSQAPANGCVPVPVCNLSASISTNNIDCYGMVSGAVTANITGGTGPYTYLWSPGGATTQTVSNLPAGCYTVTITDVNGCIVSQTACITEAAVFLATATVVNPILCNGGSALVNVTATGGTMPYTGIGSFNFTSGIQSFTLFDNNGCTLTGMIIITEPTAITLTTISTDEIVGNDGTATASVSGGTAPYSYFWTPSGQTAANATGLSAGMYTVEVTDANGCIESTQVQVGSQVGINEYSSSDIISIYPNPATEQIYISSLVEIDPTEIKIYSIDGQLVSKLDFTSGNLICLSIDQWSRGMYHVHVKTATGAYTMPFVKQ